ncbi:BsuBI/PstI family type II restriction endonuclease [Enterococcus innesii]
MPNGEQFNLSPGDHNILQKEIVEEFAPIFAPGSQLLYLGDTANKFLHIEKEKLEGLKFPPVSHDKLPDVVLYSQQKNWVYFIEAVTSHGPISPKRRLELLDIVKDSDVKPVFVTAFLTTQDFKQFVTEVSWETEVWIAEQPKHMIHLNGDKFMGPRY